jgi:hypothetical protein
MIFFVLKNDAGVIFYAENAAYECLPFFVKLIRHF